MDCRVCAINIDGKNMKGFCKTHYEQYRRKLISFEGVPKDGLYFDKQFHIRKVKSDLRNTIIECSWYRRWQVEIKKRAKYSCEICSENQSKLVIHHDKIRMSTILKECKLKFPLDLNKQMLYAESQHTIDIGLCLCLKCHAEKHKHEKMYGRLSNVVLSEKCKVCGNQSYCKNFCKFHYRRYRIKVIDADGNQLREIRKKKIVLSKPPKKEKICKICGGKFYGLGFCLTHYNRFKIKQIDSDGNQLRELKEFSTKGSKSPKRMIEFGGERKSLTDWANGLGISKSGLCKRIRMWGIDRALTENIKKTRFI